jgi:hypothetical protein
MTTENTIIKPQESIKSKNHLPTEIIKPKVLIKTKIFCNVECEWLMMVYVISNFSPVSVELVDRKTKYGICTEENIEEIRPNSTDDFDTSKYRKFKINMYGTEDYINFRKGPTDKYCFPPVTNELKIKAKFDSDHVNFSHFQIEYLSGYDHGTDYLYKKWDFLSLLNDKKIAVKIDPYSRLKGILDCFEHGDPCDNWRKWTVQIEKSRKQ